MNYNTNGNLATRSFSAVDIKNPVALAGKLTAPDTTFAKLLADQLTPAARNLLAMSADNDSMPNLLAPTVALVLSEIVAGGESLYDRDALNGTKLRPGTNKLIEKGAQGKDLVRLNTRLVQDYYPEDLMRETYEQLEPVTKQGIKFSIGKEVRKRGKEWTETYRITFQTSKGKKSKNAGSLKEALAKLDTLADSILAGEAPASKKENKARDAKARDFDKIMLEFARIGVTDPIEVLRRIGELIHVQFLLGVGISLVAFIINAIELLVKPVTPCPLDDAAVQFKAFVMARQDLTTKARRKIISAIERFAGAMPKICGARLMSGQPGANGKTSSPPTPMIFLDKIRPNDIQTWLNGRKISWRSRRDELDIVRAFFKFAQEGLHAVPPGKTAAQVTPRPKPNSNAVAVPVTVLSFTDIWRLLVNLQDLESVFFVALGVFAGLHGEEILRLNWEDITWRVGLAIQILVAPGNGKNKGNKRIAQHVAVRHPLNLILALGKGRTGRIVSRRFTRQDKVTPIVNRLQIAWDESIMRHSFASNLFGIGFGFPEVAKEMRNTEAVLRKHYYAPIPLPVAEQYWTLPVDLAIFATLPLKKRFWNWCAPLRQFPLPPQDGAPTEYPPFPPTPTAPQKSGVKKNRTRIAWPDDLEMLVLLWEKPQRLIARDLQTRSTSVSAHAKARGLKSPSSNYWFLASHGLSADVPEVVIKARAELLARQQAAAVASAQDSTASPSTPSTTAEHNPKPTSGPVNPEPGDHANPS
jgi:integrase